MTRPAPFIAGTIAALVLLFGAYEVAYYAMLERPANPWTRTGPPVYRLRGSAVEIALWPAYRLDLLIRPGYWGDE